MLVNEQSRELMARRTEYWMETLRKASAGEGPRVVTVGLSSRGHGQSYLGSEAVRELPAGAQGLVQFFSAMAGGLQDRLLSGTPDSSGRMGRILGFMSGVVDNADSGLRGRGVGQGPVVRRLPGQDMPGDGD